MGTAGETISIAVCSTGATRLDMLAQVVRAAGPWTVIPIQWPDARVLLDELRTRAHVLVLHSGASGRDRAGDELVALLAARAGHVPLIVVGDEPARGATPNMWLPGMPTSDLLARVIEPLLDSQPKPAVPQPSWRRKSDIIIGDSPAIRELLHTLDHLAAAQTPVLVTGESGTGKELVARSLHYCGPRAQAPFIALNCAAIPENLIEAELFGNQRGAYTGAVAAREGAFEAADGGTLFLDEIGEMPLAMQAKLLRVLETSEVQRIGSTEPKKVDFRLVSATNRNLEIEVRQGRFREDLYYRVMVYPIHVPPLRDRLEDLPRLVTHYLGVIATRDNRPALRLTAGALEKLVSYRWPGNVRELVNLLERAALLARGTAIDADQIIYSPDGGANEGSPRSLVPYREAKAQFEHDYYAHLVRAANGNISLAAKLAAKTRKEIYDALRRHGLDLAGSALHQRRRRRLSTQSGRR
ncbi:MAG: sigma-54 interaction domain-containing protein [Acidobacteriota bacterium]